MACILGRMAVPLAVKFGMEEMSNQSTTIGKPVPSQAISYQCINGASIRSVGDLLNFYNIF